MTAASEARGEAPDCKMCGSSMWWTDCDLCGGDGLYGHDCGEDSCCCADPDEANLRCDQCNGDGGWWSCLSDPEWCATHPLTPTNPPNESPEVVR